MLGEESIDVNSTLYQLYTCPYRDYYEKVEITYDVHKKAPLAVSIDDLESESSEV